MNQKYLIYLMLVLLAFAAGCEELKKKDNKTEESTDQMIEDLLQKMTLEEKVGQMTQVTLGVFGKGGKADERPEPFEFDEKVLDSAFRMYKLGSVLNTVNNKAQSPEWWNKIIEEFNKRAIEETGIPILYGVDAIHGVGYTSGATLFPQQIGQGATFNPELVKELNEFMAYEMRACNIPWTFGPVQDMGRDARDPRIWETYGEDVYLAQRLGDAAVKGIQGDNASLIGPYHGAACLKHFLAYNSDSGKDRNPLTMSVRDLKGIHAASFQAAVDAGAQTIMINSGLINGVPVHANYQILTQLLRNEMGFKGMVVTDWKDIENIYIRDKIASSHKEAVKLAINAGIDMSMVPYNFRFCDYLIELVEEGEVPMTRIDEAVRRVLQVKIDLGLFETPNTYLKDYPDFGSEKSEKLAYQAALESITLLKNNNDILPLNTNKKVLVCGPNSNSLRTMNGGWSYSWQGEKVEQFTDKYLSFKEAIEQKVGKSKVSYVEGVSYNNEGKYYEEKNIQIEKAVKAAKKVDVIVLFLGENTYTEKPGDLHDLYISENQSNLALALAKTGKPVVLVLNEGRPRLISKFENKMNAVLHTYLPSNYGGLALADILYGDENPSGKLPFTYPMYPNSLTTYDYLPSENQEKMEGEYDYESVMAVQYAFGTGLSYTQFEYSNFKVEDQTFNTNGKVKVSIDVKNIGDRSGKEVVMLYTKDKVASISPRNKQLKRFDKIELAKGEKKTVSFEIDTKDLAFYNYNNQMVTEKGEFDVMIGNFKKTIVLENDVVFGEASKVRL
jgi:beta-glucosidase